MWVGVVALFVAVIGAALEFTVLPVIGARIATLGILLGMLGVVIHFVKNWREIFHVDRR
jgi:hypothetical protein